LEVDPSGGGTEETDDHRKLCTYVLLRVLRLKATGPNVNEEEDNTDNASDGGTTVNEELSDEEVEPVPFTPEELRALLLTTPSPWAQIQPTVAHQLPLNDGGPVSPSTEDLQELLKCYRSYPFHTSQNPAAIQNKITWKARRGGDMAMVAGASAFRNPFKYRH
jgi:hypothetical protein